MTFARLFRTSVRAVGLTALAATAQAASLEVDFQATIASEQHPTYAGEARYYHVSVNPANPGTGSYAATIVGTNNPAPTFVRPFDGDVVAYKFAGGANNDITAVAQSGGDASLITFSTTDTSFDGFGQSQAKIWTTTDPGADIQTTIADPFNAVDDVGSTGGWRSLGGAIGSVDVSGLEAGSVHIYYGSFNATPTVSVVMRDTDGPAPDLTITDAHSVADGGNGDTANRTEYYLAEIDFVTDGVYDVVEFTWDSDGDGDLATGNGRGIATVLTDAPPDVPFLVSTDPADDAIDVPVDQNLVATFSEDITPGTGNVIIKNIDTTTDTIIAIDDTTQVNFAGSVLTIDPVADLLDSTNYAIQIESGAIGDTDATPNLFAGITDNTTWNFTTIVPDVTVPTLDLFEDDKGAGLVFEGDTVTYTLTFSEAMNASTIEVGDFSNSASATASITVDSVTEISPEVYEVVVSPTSLGTIQLQVNASANLEDLSGNALDTSSAIPDDTVITVIELVANDGSITVDFQGTIASEQHPTYPGEARYYHVSVNPANPGTGSYAATIVGTNDPAPTFVRPFLGPVVAYKFAGGANNDITAVAQSGGDASLITFSTSDTTFDGFGQSQAKIWTVTDPGADLQTTIADPFNAVDDVGSTGGWRSLGGAVGTVDISGLESGSVHIYYGAFNATPSVSVVMRDTDGLVQDLTITDAHSIADGGNGDNANRTEYYLAEIDFVTDGLYDEIEFEWLANGSDYSGNGRGIATVLTGPEVLGEYGIWAALYPGADLSDPDADLDGDGLSNDYERIFGLDPTNALSSKPISPLDSDTGAFSFTRRDPSLTGLFSDIETSFDLEMWTGDGDATLVVGDFDASLMIETVNVVISPGLLTAPDLFVRVNQNDGSLLSENFEADNGGFTVATTAGDSWEYGTPASSSPGGVVTGGNSGSNAWGTLLGDGGANPGQYADSTVTALRSPVIDLTGVAAAELLFAEALDLEAGDTAVVNIIDDTTDAVIAAAVYTATDASNSDALWNNVSPIAIPAAALGQPVRIEWSFTGFGGASNDYLGWYIDDVTVRKTMGAP